MPDTLDQLRNGQLTGATRLDLRCGLTEFPQEIFDLADSLEILNLTGNRLRTLPDDLGRLKKLRILFCSENEFTHVPAVLGECSALRMVGFKANQIETVDAGAFPASLRWLILTDNRIQDLPPTLGQCTKLQKLMLSGNRLSHLPDELAACTNLELVRLAANQFTSLPPWLLELPRLSWLAYAGNPCSSGLHKSSTSQALARVPWSSLSLEKKLGEGASGEIHRALWQVREGEAAHPVAVKLFKGSVTSDGLPSCEMEACLAAGAQDYLIPVLGRVMDHPTGSEGLVLFLIDPSYITLAGPPSFESCTRDVYGSGLRFTPSVALSLALGVALAAQHLHTRGIMHGDLYAHNVLWNPAGACYLGDFGGATFYDRKDQALARALQGLEVSAFGCLLEELLERCDWQPGQQEIARAMNELSSACLGAKVLDRPSFDDVVRHLQRHRLN